MNNESMMSESNKCLSSVDIQENDGISGVPLIPPRVGPQYQAKLPPLLKRSTPLNFTIRSTMFRNKTDRLPHFSVGSLPVPLMWAPKDSQNGLNEVTNVDTQSYPVPEIERFKPWNEIERSSFLLGLYLFEKNLVLVKKFMSSKTMGELLSYYYREFYGSNDHRRWSIGRYRKSSNPKKGHKGKRKIQGAKVFKGWRRQKLLSRLSCDATQDCVDLLNKVSMMLDEGKLPFNEYVFTLKEIVGLDKLVEAVAIGKGKKDLIGIDMGPAKVNRSFRVHANIPDGKTCSSLTSSKIIEILNGDFRLSKARANDLFNNAIWPRLLSKGWKAQQPYDGGSKHSVVYLMPGIHKYSRELIKGNEYFDSVSDILLKIASEPRLVELEGEGEPEPEPEPTEQELEISSNVASEGKSVNDQITKMSKQMSLSGCSYKDFIHGAENVSADESCIEMEVLELSEDSLNSTVSRKIMVSSKKFKGPSISIDLFSDDYEGSSKKESGPHIVIDLNIPFVPMEELIELEKSEILNAVENVPIPIKSIEKAAKENGLEGNKNRIYETRSKRKGETDSISRGVRAKK